MFGETPANAKGMGMGEYTIFLGNMADFLNEKSEISTYICNYCNGRCLEKQGTIAFIYTKTKHRRWRGGT